MVVSHEFGHFIVAKKSGIRVDEFAFGFPPRIASVQKGETRYSLNALPLGGYVKIFGENPDEESLNGPDANRSFANKPRRIQAAVLFAGVAMNFLVAWLLFSVGFMTGLPTSIDSVPAGAKLENAELAVTSVLPGSPAEISGLQVGDRITHLSSKTGETDIPSTQAVQYFIRTHTKEEITLTYNRGKESLTTKLTPKEKMAGDEPGIGIGMDMIGTLSLPLHKAVWEGLKLSVNLVGSTVKGFYNLIHNAVVGHADMSSITGPVGIVKMVGSAASFGFIYLLSFTALISINLAVINLLPFPALDGGRLLFLLIEKIKGSRIKPKISNMANAIGFAILMLLMAVVTYHDIAKLF